MMPEHPTTPRTISRWEAGDFFHASGSISDDNGTPTNSADDFNVGDWGPLAPGANSTVTHNAVINSTTTNTAVASGISGTCNVSTSASATVTAHKCSISLTK